MNGKDTTKAVNRTKTTTKTKGTTKTSTKQKPTIVTPKTVASEDYEAWEKHINQTISLAKAAHSLGVAQGAATTMGCIAGGVACSVCILVLFICLVPHTFWAAPAVCVLTVLTLVFWGKLADRISASHKRQEAQRLDALGEKLKEIIKKEG